LKVSTLTNRLGPGNFPFGPTQGECMSDTENIGNVTHIVNGAHIGMLTTVNEEGSLVSRPLAVQEVRDDGDMCTSVPIRG